MPLTGKEFGEGMREFEEELLRKGRGIGPVYNPGGYRIPWSDQYFEREMEPAGVVNCRQALRVGSTLSTLDIFLKANENNTEAMRVPAGSTITLTLLQGDSEDGTFEDVGPSVCVRAPAAGMEIEPGMMVCRFPIGDFDKPWLMATLEFGGAITGGKVDCCLGFIPR